MKQITSLQETGLRITKEPLFLPLQLATWVIGILAQRESGKTYTAGVLIEEFFKNGIPFVVIDPLGIYWGLKYKQKTIDGIIKAELGGLPLLVLGGSHGDRALSLEAIPALVETIVKTNMNCVLDVSEFSDYKDLQIVDLFCKLLAKANRHKRQIIIEEADLFCSETVTFPQEVACRHSVIEMIVRGGNNNLGCVLISQRSASVAKKALTQANCLIILRTTAPQDKKVIMDWVSSKKSKSKEQEKILDIIDNLDRLEPGEAYIFKPTKPDPILLEFVHIRERETLHATRAWREQEVQDLPQLDIKQQLEVFDSTFKNVSKLGEYDLLTQKQLIDLVKKTTLDYRAAVDNLAKSRVTIQERDSKIHELEFDLKGLDSKYKSSIGKLGANEHQLEEAKNQSPSFPSSDFSRETISFLQQFANDFNGNRLKALIDLSDLQISAVESGKSPPLIIEGETGIRDVQIQTEPSPPLVYSTNTNEGKVLKILIEKFRGKSTEYKKIREIANEIPGWKIDPNDMTRAKKKLVDDQVCVDNGTFLRTKFSLGKVTIDGEEMSLE